MQDSITAIEQCHRPVIVAVHGKCIGAGIDLITACDVRFCTEDAEFSVKACFILTSRKSTSALQLI